jgi:TonB family protein
MKTMSQLGAAAVLLAALLPAVRALAQASPTPDRDPTAAAPPDVSGAAPSERAPLDALAAGGSAEPAPSDVAQPPVESPASVPITRFETQLEFDQLVDAERFAEALPLGPSLIELTSKEFGATSIETARAYQQVADAQRLAGEQEAAIDSYLKSVDVYREADGPFSALVIEPLTGLGDAYQQAGNHLTAVSVYGEARTVTRRSFGLLNERQIPLLDRLTVSLTAMGQHVEADQQQREALRLVERNHAPHSPEALAALYKYAKWLGENGRFQEEREQYMRALRTIRDQYGESSPVQVPAMRGIGNSFRVQRIPDGQGVSNLREALTLLLAQPDPDELALAEVLRDLGDWEVAFNKAGYDGAEYRRAWQLLEALPNADRLQRAWFSGASYVLREPISQRDLSEAADALVGHVLVRFDLDALGRSMNVRVVESNPPGLKDEAVLRHVRRSRFRPQMVNGEIVPGTGLALQFNYRYTPNEAFGEQTGRED